MHIVDLRCRESASCAANRLYMPLDSEKLYVGWSSSCDYLLYLFFSLPPGLQLQRLRQAKLILYRVPANCGYLQSGGHDRLAGYGVYPLSVYFSPYGGAALRQGILPSLGAGFWQDAAYYCTEVDVTSIVRAWIGGQVENKGLLVTGGWRAPLTTYASHQNGMEAIRPKLRLLFDDPCFTKPLSLADCEVKVEY